MDTELDFTEKVSLARLALLKKKHFAFISSILYKMKIIPNLGIQTIYYNGLDKEIYVNPNWFDELPIEHAASALAHEVLHYALQHDIRQGNKIPELYQKACDEVVNNLLLDSNFELPSDVVVDRQYQKKSTEEVYLLVKEEHDNNNNPNQNSPDNNPGQSPGNPGANGNSLGQDLPNNSNSPSNNQQNIRNREVQEADSADKAVGGESFGQSSEAFENLFEEIAEGKLDWQTILSEHVNQITKSDRTFERLERRYLPMGLYLPSQDSTDKVEKVAVAIDVSGSVYEPDVRGFLAQLRAIKHQCNPDEINFVTFNWDIVEEFSFKQHESFQDLNLQIGGGTSLHPVFEHYNKHKPDFLIVLSDLECQEIPEEEKPTYPVIWICLDNKHAEVNFGKLIHVTSEDLTDGLQED